MNKNTVIWIVAIVVLALAGYGIYRFAQNYDVAGIRAEITAENDRLNSAYKATIVDLQQQIDKKNSELTTIYDSLAAAASRRTSVKPPASNPELRKRFTDAGYPPK